MSYDHLGNRYQETSKNGTVYTYSHNPVNRYSKRSYSIMGFAFDEVYEYDDNGNLSIDFEGNTYIYDYRNRLIHVEDSESNTIADYTFDALGRRIKKVVGDTTTYFFYDPQGRAIAEYEGESPEMTREFVYGNGFNEVLAMFTPEYTGDPDDWQDFLEFCQAWLCQDPNACYDATYDHNSDDIINFKDFAYFASVWDMPSSAETDWYYLTDALGSVRGLIGGRFNREDDREFYNYDVYGKLSIQNPEETVSGNPYLFGGYRYDVETGLYHTDCRAYDPETGRWLQVDPIHTLDSMNLYEYVRSNPVMHIDPLGLFFMVAPPGVYNTTATPRSLSAKITELLALRTIRGFAVPFNIYNRFRDEYELNDEIGEMNKVFKGDIGSFYAKVVAHNKSSLDAQIEKWKYLSFPPPSPDYSKWRPGIGGEFGSLAYWLHGAYDVKAKGKVEAQKTCAGRYLIRKRNTDFEWIDEIDANSYRELKSKPAGAFEKFLEGGIGDILGDKILGMGFKIRITWTDKQEDEQDITTKVKKHF